MASVPVPYDNVNAPGLSWSKSQASKDSDLDHCAVFADAGDKGVAFSNSNDPTAPVTYFTAEEFGAFLDGATAGDWNHLRRA